MMKKVTILQEALPHFRIPFFNRLGELYDLTVYYSDPNGVKRRNIPDQDLITSFRCTKASAFLVKNGLLSFHPKVLFDLLQDKPDVLIMEARIGFITAQLAALLPLFSSKKVWWLSGYEPLASPKIDAFKSRIRKRMYGYADSFICYSTKGVDHLNRYGIFDNIYIAYNSLDTDEIALTRMKTLIANEWEERKTKIRNGVDFQILYVGRLEKKKNVDLLIHAIHELYMADTLNKFQLLCIGGGEELLPLMELVKKLKLTSIVKFIGPMYELEQLAYYFLSSDVFVLPGLGGLAINQAINFGLPVILCEADGSERDMVVDGVNGFYFKQNDTNDLCNKINIIIRSKSLIASMALKSVEIARSTSNMHKMIEGFVAAIEK